MAKLTNHVIKAVSSMETQHPQKSSTMHLSKYKMRSEVSTSVSISKIAAAVKI